MPRGCNAEEALPYDGTELLFEQMTVRAHIDNLKSILGLDPDTGEATFRGVRVPMSAFGNQRGSAKRTSHSRAKKAGRQHRRRARGRA